MSEHDKVGRRPGPVGGRRRFLTAAGGLVGAAALATASRAAEFKPEAPEWTRILGPGVDAAPYGKPSPHEKHVIRRAVDWLTPTPQSSVNFTPLHELDGILTPNGLCFERHHAGVPDIPPAEHKLLLHGLVERPLRFSMAELRRFPPTSVFHFLECAANGGMEWRGAQLNGVQYTHGMVHCVQYTGVPLRTLLEAAGVKDNARWLLVEGADAAAMTRSLPLAKARDDCLVAYSMNGERLRAEQGYPLRLVVPGWEGNIWIKWLRRIEVGDQPWHSREETAKYTDLMPDGRARQFTFVQEVKSVITHPAPEARLEGKGFHCIKGLAWSGEGRIARVDVSLDGGRNWATARLEPPVMPKCLTRFYLDWQWTGGEALLQSRAIDERGYVQPTAGELRKLRGVNPIYHNNGIQTWLVNGDGTVENVRLG